jgi:uncharacterized membrane protein YgcG
MYVTYLTGDIDIGRGASVTAATTIIAAATIIIIATWAIITVLLAWAVLVPTIIIAGPVILAWTTVVVACSVLLALLLSWTMIIMARSSVATSHVGGGGEPRLIGFVLPVKGLYLSEELSEGGVGFGIDSSTEIVVVAPEALQDVVDKFIIIERFSHRDKFGGD